MNLIFTIYFRTSQFSYTRLHALSALLDDYLLFSLSESFASWAGEIMCRGQWGQLAALSLWSMQLAAAVLDDFWGC